MNDFSSLFDCYRKAKKKTTIVLCAIGLPLCLLTGFPVAWYAWDFHAESLIGSIFVKIVLWILFPVLMIWVAGLVEKLFGRVLLRCFFRRQKGR